MFNQNKNNKIMSFDRHTLTPNLMFKASPTSQFHLVILCIDFVLSDHHLNKIFIANPIVYFYNFALFFLVNTK
ncbi:hypothetical protein YC2023_017689 [Brassica napus]